MSREGSEDDRAANSGGRPTSPGPGVRRSYLLGPPATSIRHPGTDRGHKVARCRLSSVLKFNVAASLEMEPTRLTVRVIISPRRAAHFAR
jgi:hypothetical protein